MASWSNGNDASLSSWKRRVQFPQRLPNNKSWHSMGNGLDTYIFENRMEMKFLKRENPQHVDFYPGYILGYRCWSIRDKLLSSQNWGGLITWPAQEKIESLCILNRSISSLKDIKMINDFRHESPRKDCTCGIYMYSHAIHAISHLKHSIITSHNINVELKATPTYFDISLSECIDVQPPRSLTKVNFNISYEKMDELKYQSFLMGSGNIPDVNNLRIDWINRYPITDIDWEILKRDGVVMFDTYVPVVFGIMAGWGKIIEHESGYRTQYAYPQSLVVIGENDLITYLYSMILKDTYAIHIRSARSLYLKAPWYTGILEEWANNENHRLKEGK